jgi:hypothetical protein
LGLSSISNNHSWANPRFIHVALDLVAPGMCETVAMERFLTPLVTPEEQKMALVALCNVKLTRDAIALAAVDDNVIPMR